MRLALIVAAVVLSGSVPAPEDGAAVRSVRVTPDTLRLEVGDTSRVVCEPRNSKAGTGAILTAACTWASSNSARLAVAADGKQAARVIARQIGTAFVTASVKGIRDTLRVVVVTLVSQSAEGAELFDPVVTVQPRAVSLDGAAARATLQAHVRDPVIGPIAGASCAWTVRDPAIIQSISSTKLAVTLVPLSNGASYVACASSGDSDSALATVSGINPLPPGVAINPGENWQTKIDANPTGTVFIVKSGIHRFPDWTTVNGVNPKASQQFFGEAGAIVTGARVLSSWTASGAYWFAGGQTQQNTDFNPNYTCQSGHDGCYLPEQLFVNDTLYERMTTQAAVTAGSQKWYFDYSADRIYIARNPSGQSIETSVTRYAFGGTATDVVVKHLTIERFANAAQASAVNYNNTNARWTIDTNEVRYNHGNGVSVGTGGKIRGNYIHHQGQMGVKAFGTNPLVEDNEIAFNNTAFFGPGTFGEAGATKFVSTNGLIVRGNYSHDNDGPGLWTDINNVNCLYENNEVHDNKWRGIFHEISYKCVIRNNNVTGNGHEFPSTYGAFEGAGILISNSPDVEVYGNYVEGNRAGIMAREETRDQHPSAMGPHNNLNIWVHDNVVIQTNGQRAGGIADSDPDHDPYSVASNNRWGPDNQYTVVGSTRWRWAPNVDYTFAAFQAAGQDVGSTQTGQ